VAEELCSLAGKPVMLLMGNMETLVFYSDNV